MNRKLPAFALALAVASASAPASSRAWGAEDRLEKDSQAVLSQISAGTLSGTAAQSALKALDSRYAAVLAGDPRNEQLHVWYGNVLTHMSGDGEDRAAKEWTTAVGLDPKDSSAWTSLADHYADRGMTEKCFQAFDRAYALAPTDPVLIADFAFILVHASQSPAASKYYGLDSAQLIDKAMEMYRQALGKTPSYELASGMATLYYNVRPLRINDALAAWQTAQKLAPSEVERQFDDTHLARWEMGAGNYDAARAYLAKVNDPSLQAIKNRMLGAFPKK